MAFLKFISGVLVALFFAGAAGAVGNPEEDAGPSRLAIVIGNSNYLSERYQDLANAANDARSISEALKVLKFEVITGVDLTQEAWKKILDDVSSRLDSYDAVVVYYAGHGVQFQGENFLLPVDALDPDSVDSLVGKAIKLNDIIRAFASRDHQTLIFLDACRNNPLGSGADAPAGLAQLDVGENTFVAFATEPGKVTADGTGSNSPFTTAMLKYLTKTNTGTIFDTMLSVKKEIDALTAGRQQPWIQSSLMDNFRFNEFSRAEIDGLVSQILANPKWRDRFRTELAASDLTTAALIVGEQMRSVSLDTAPGTEPAEPEPGIQIASLPVSTGEGGRDAVVSDLKTLIVGTSGSQDQATLPELPMLVQRQLSRLGCYRKAVDGDWGAGSKRALTDYYRFSKKTAPEQLEPTADIYAELAFLPEGRRVCKWKEPVKPPKPVRTTSVSTDDGQAATRTKGKGKGKRTGAAKRPAAPPPDISSGIGIGGVF